MKFRQASRPVNKNVIHLNTTSIQHAAHSYCLRLKMCTTGLAFTRHVKKIYEKTDLCDLTCVTQFFFVNFAVLEGTTKREELAPPAMRGFIYFTRPSE